MRRAAACTITAIIVLDPHGVAAIPAAASSEPPAPPPLPGGLPSEPELMAYARGWLDGYERAYRDGFGDGADASAQHWTECVRRANRRSEQAGAAKRWRAIVLSGGNPADEQPQRR